MVAVECRISIVECDMCAQLQLSTYCTTYYPFFGKEKGEGFAFLLLTPSLLQTINPLVGKR